jgi:hypothetical protein
MITFHLPNFRCKVSDITLDCNGNVVISDKKSSRYFYAESPQKAEELLQKDLSLHVHEVEPCDFVKDWKDAVEGKRKEVAEAIAGNKKPPFTPLWTDLKEHLITLFSRKCGYCEARFTPTSFGDVEHFRPKGRVDEDKNHKGYYWLAYEPTNYLPACQICNEAAKRDHFPIAGTRAYSENDPLDDEEPLLINPYRDAFEDHLEFIPSTHPIGPVEPGKPPALPGGVIGKTKKGRESIRNLGIYRELIREARADEMGHARINLKHVYIKFIVDIDPPGWEDFKHSLQEYLSEDRPFRTAVYYEMRECLVNLNAPEEWVRKVFVEVGFHA